MGKHLDNALLIRRVLDLMIEIDSGDPDIGKVVLWRVALDRLTEAEADELMKARKA